MTAPSLKLRALSKSYAIYDRPGDRLKELLTFNRHTYHRDYWALRDITFDISRGETFCVIGENGAGKSTLLQIIAGIAQPSSGSISVHGRVSALLELGAGFNPDFTGHDNVYLNATILGLTRDAIEAKYPDIERFAEIGEFMHQPVRTYSSGMMVRLAFAVAIHVDPDILLVDEALAVGDIYFRQRCMRKVHDLRERGTTILFVSHSMADVKTLGTRTLWLENGQARALGETSTVVAEYLGEMAAKDSAYLGTQDRPTHAPQSIGTPPELVTDIPNIDHRHGDRRAEILGIAVVDSTGEHVPLLKPETPIVVRISVRANETLNQPNIGFMLRNHLGVDFAGTNTSRDGYPLPSMQPGDIYTVDFHFDLPILYPGHFSFSPAIADGTHAEYRMCDWIDNAVTLEMAPTNGPVYGFLHLPCRIELNRRLTDANPVEAS